MVVVELARRRQGDRDGVAQAHRARKMQRLVDVDRSRTGYLNQNRHALVAKGQTWIAPAYHIGEFS
jgi:hypothetical protein